MLDPLVFGGCDACRCRVRAHANDRTASPPMTTPTALRHRQAVILTIGVAALTIGAYVEVPLNEWCQRHTHHFEHNDLFQMLRSGGYMGTWFVAAAALTMIDWRRTTAAVGMQWARGLALLLAPGFAGLLAEGLKIVFRRERPQIAHAWYVFRDFNVGPFHSGGLCMPSSHAAVVFGGAFVLVRLFPAATPVWLVLATATAVSRVLTGAHYVTDVCAGVAVGAACAWAVCRLLFGPDARTSAYADSNGVPHSTIGAGWSRGRRIPRLARPDVHRHQP
jgi:membrane-associated phospholipid phosphatase